MDICGHRNAGRVCDREPGHSGPHSDDGCVLSQWRTEKQADPSPRASSELSQPYWDATGKCTRCGTQGNGYQACPNCFGLRQAGIDANYGTRVGSEGGVAYHVLAMEISVCKRALAVSEKERERLKAELMSNTEHLTAAHWKDEANKLRRELENLKRSTNAELGDMRGGLEHLENIYAISHNRAEFLRRELDRERAKNKKRGL